MAQNVIHVRGRRADILAVLRKLPAICRGGSGEATAAAQAMMTRIGMVALGRIKQAFVTKSRGGTDEAGDKWPPLAPSTIAYSRRHPGVLWPGKKRAPYAPSWMLTEKQRARWWDLYRRFRGAAPQGAAFHAAGQDHGWAAAKAWMVLKGEGAKTLMDVYGATPVDILKDTGLLLNSLSPGVAVGSGAPAVPNQVFNVGAGYVIVGTSRKWAAVHHRGNARTPQRRLWPPPSKWPAAWWADILAEARQGLIDITVHVLGGTT